ncbi:MAG TPA: glycerol-3-phosphate dehydrogenase, partial [Clostridiales bacterium]|nr:glycerol-3-phosphate dehydrogenase [Clostridiales bacterium]
YEDTKHTLINALSSNLIRFYFGEDLIGTEIGAAAKNVIGIAAGMLDGLHLTSLKGALMSRG